MVSKVTEAYMYGGFRDHHGLMGTQFRHPDSEEAET
jgi:hypothetical protein